MSEHTKGPWEYREGYLLLGKPAKYGCRVFPVTPDMLSEEGFNQFEIDSRLIAAAPDLLATLEDIARFLDGPYMSAIDADYAIYLDAARDAIKQAKGE